MQEGLLQIGNALSSGESSIDNFIKKVSYMKSKKQLYVLKLNFDLIDKELIIDTKEEMDKNTAKKYNFIGSTGARTAQWYASSDKIDYHLSETMKELAKKDLGEELNEKIQRVVEIFFYNLEGKVENKYAYLLDLKKLGISDKSIEEIYEESKDDSNVGKSMLGNLVKEFESYLKNNKDQNLKDFGLFIVQIDGKTISQNEKYINEVIESKSPKGNGKLTSEGGICSICQTMDNLTGDLTKTQIKLYTTNQIIFASQLDKGNYFKNMQLCESCLMKLQAGENYTIKHLNTKLAKFSVYIIPQFIYGEPLNEKELNMISDRIIKSFNTINSFKSIEKLKDDIQNLLHMKDIDSYFLLNLLFYTKSQASTKVQLLIKDVNPSIFEKIAKGLIRANEIIKNLMGNNWTKEINLTTVYFMHPIRLSKGNPVQYRDVLQTYDQIFTEKSINKKHLIENIIDCVKIIRFEKDSYNIESKRNIEFYILEANIYLKFLEQMDCIKEGKGLQVENLMVKDDMKDFISEMKYNEEQTAMFLLGILIGEIGNSQYDRDSEDKNKPILNKINWNGVDTNKIIRLTKDVFNKLNQEKIRQYNEITFSEMKRLLDKNIGSWTMNKDENLFYILSGYSYTTAKQILKGAKRDEK